MRNRRGVLVYTSPVALSVSRVIHAPRVHLRPDGSGRLLLHSEETDNAVRVSGRGDIGLVPGATLCLRAGDLVTAEALGDDRSGPLAPFRFERF